MTGHTFSFGPSRFIQARPPRLPQQAVPSQSTPQRCKLATSSPRFTSQKQEDTLGGGVQGLEPQGLGLNPSSSLTVHPPAGLSFCIRRMGMLGHPPHPVFRGAQSSARHVVSPEEVTGISSSPFRPVFTIIFSTVAARENSLRPMASPGFMASQ